MPKFVLLWTDAAMWLMAASLVAYTVMVLRRPGLSANWKKVFRDAAALSSSVILLLCLALTLLDSLHFRPLLPPAPPAPEPPPPPPVLLPPQPKVVAAKIAPNAAALSNCMNQSIPLLMVARSG